jgi:hypothetical protein
MRDAYVLEKLERRWHRDVLATVGCQHDRSVMSAPIGETAQLLCHEQRRPTSFVVPQNPDPTQRWLTAAFRAMQPSRRLLLVAATLSRPYWAVTIADREHRRLRQADPRSGDAG